MQFFRHAIGVGICLVLSIPVVAGTVYNFDLSNQYASGALASSVTFTSNPSNPNITVTALGYAQASGSLAYTPSALYANAGGAGLGLSDALNSNQISQRGHEFVQLNIGNLLAAAPSAGLTSLGLTISGVDPAAKDMFFIYGGSKLGATGSILGSGSSNGRVSFDLSTLISRNFTYLTVTAPSGGVLISNLTAAVGTLPVARYPRSRFV